MQRGLGSWVGKHPCQPLSHAVPSVVAAQTSCRLLRQAQAGHGPKPHSNRTLKAIVTAPRPKPLHPSPTCSVAMMSVIKQRKVRWEVSSSPRSSRSVCPRHTAAAAMPP